MDYKSASDGRIITRDNLSALMEFEHVIRVHADGTISEPRDVWAPECYMDSAIEWNHGGPAPELSARKPHVDKPWSLMNGYSGQDRYSGPIMHSSEFIGGGMARDILETPGLYVAVVVTDQAADEDDDHSDAGWAVAYQHEDI